MAGNQLRSHFVQTDFEQKLRADDNGLLRDDTVAGLDRLAADLQSQKRSGLAPQDYFRAERLLAGVRVARNVIRRTWNGLHGS